MRSTGRKVLPVVTSVCNHFVAGTRLFGTKRREVFLPKADSFLPFGDNFRAYNMVDKTIDVVLVKGDASVTSEIPVTDLYKGFRSVEMFSCLGVWSKAERHAFWVANERESADNAGKKPQNVFDVSKLALNIKECGIYGSTVLFAHCVTSTQSIIHDLCGGFPDGTVCVADVQTNGRGRGSNEWSSPPGCLLFSYTSAVRDGRTLPLVQYLVCLAIVKAVKSLPGMGGLDIGIKWPNDIYVNKKVKIGGILCQSICQGAKFKVTIGVGLNVDNSEPTTCLNDLGEEPVSREQVLGRILEHYESLLLEFEHDGFEKRIQGEYEKAWLHSGQTVTLKEENDAVAVIEGLNPASGGCLLARVPETGQLYELYPDGNRLDFFNGLISKKKL
mmetsp:Transcript_15638/g.27271  ORF Transcript_15638/g.27271 Transcript_15638/m.27271 type:complete len:387 (+) Transcript_15638:359-1519(+)